MASQTDNTIVETTQWSDLPLDILKLIVSRLPLAEHPNVFAVCKNWSHIASPIYPADRSPLLLHFKQEGDGICRYYSPSFDKTFVVDRPIDLLGARVYFARDGWLVLYKLFEVILANPITGVMHRFPGLQLPLDYNGIAFCGCPPNSYWIFAIQTMFENFVEISFYDGKDWVPVTRHYNKMPFLVAEGSNPVFCDGRFFCLGTKGDLGVYNPRRDSWTVLDNPKEFGYGSYEKSFLTESKGELTAVLIGECKSVVKVFHLNMAEMVWQKVGSLDDQTLFVGSPTSLMMATPVRRMQNKVYPSSIHVVPETILADVIFSERRIFFVPKETSSTNTATITTTEDTQSPIKCGMCYYSLETGGHCECSKWIEYAFSTWYEAGLGNN